MSLNHSRSQDLLNKNHEYTKLFQSYQELENKISRLTHSPTSRDEITRLKKQKLHVQDCMYKIEQRGGLH